MMEVAACIVQEHDLRLVIIAIVVALVGSAATVQLFGRILASQGKSRLGWIVLSSVGTGTMVWCTHFVAMMGFRAGFPVTLNPELTLASLAVAIALAAPGLALAASHRRTLVPVGGAVVGIAISTMHYTGMMAYRIDGIVEWRWPFVIASVLLSSTLSALAFNTFRTSRPGRRVGGCLLLGLAVAMLHFTGMAAIKVSALTLSAERGLSDTAMTQLALGTACAGLLFIGCAAVSALIDGETQNDAYRRMRRMALHDGLTDLPNRQAFNEELTIRRERKGGTSHLAVIMIDLARFKNVNDTYGHQAGDQLLMALADRMTSALLAGECISRLGGDEFAALISYTDRSDLDDFLRRISEVFTEPFLFVRFSATIGANIGVALAPQDGTDADLLLARADLAMYRAKSEHSTAPCFYDATMDDVSRSKRELASELRDAITKGGFELHYQVQAEIATGEISGYEALVRWQHPSRGLIAPMTFIPLAEETGSIIPLSNWIIAQACFEAALWPNQHVVAVNLSPLHLSDPGLIDMVRYALENSGLSPSRLTIELTESAIIHDRRYALEQLVALKALGVGLALDDFGVGYSSLDVLRSFAFDRIKLDKSFVDELETDEQAVALLQAIVALGTTLHIPVLAEGIEVPNQLRIAADAGCFALQGYLIGKPSRKLVDPTIVRSTVCQATSRNLDVSLVA
ncbi:putative bifunctional diguanylate cyclase/phosphodiesterase [Sphingomonas echinoides]|uniref:putative bifunctional diguanylate cyclase/phosphodiesterase n=1 Tax=Sphingomonas echinoides TaxID=59803 RepID=UPI002412F20E|nr:EAL domain-containing protein [Sphingomonas echinoides]